MRVACLVIGAGPAGLAAARAAAASGVEVLLVDEQPAAGGQWSGLVPRLASSTDPARRLAPRGVRDPGGAAIGAATSPARAGALVAGLAAEVRRLRVARWFGVAAWAMTDGRTVALAACRGAATEVPPRVTADAVVLATGGYDRPVPFPGWTLPGVMTAGAAWRLVQDHGVLPGGRVLVAGSGPFLLPLARLLRRAGSRVVLVAEAAARLVPWRWRLGLLAHLDAVQWAWRDRRELERLGAPVATGHVIRQALGTMEVERVQVGACDAAWAPLPGTERTLDADAVVMAYGTLPAVELAQLAGCRLTYQPERDVWVPARTPSLETTLPGVYAVGDAAGRRGVAAAVLEGELAGAAVARRLGRLSPQAYARRRAVLGGWLRHLAGLERVWDEAYRPRPGLYALALDRTVVCRCEEVSVTDVRAAVVGGARCLEDVLARTGAGAGPCQGRFCAASLAHLIARVTGRPVAEAGLLPLGSPARPRVGRPPGHGG